ncbi:hypothetical protein B0H13DRAFT_2652668 [Mycena leptocephala]|nr:hypothetical protein B0H13DRAFT_2652668 [Mycena leptocephala]
MDIRPGHTTPSDETHPTSTEKVAAISPFSAQFLDKSLEASAARTAYLKAVVSGVIALGILVFAVFSIYWGSVWRTPHHTLPGWVVDFDGGAIGNSVSVAFTGLKSVPGGIAWEVVSASNFPGGISQLEHAVVQEKTWYAVAINSGASANLSAAVGAVDPSSYDSSMAITFIASEARNENIYRIHTHIFTGQLEAVSHQFAVQFTKNLTSSNVANLLSAAPELIVRPIYYSINNIRPFDVPVAGASTFFGLIYLLIIAFIVVLISTAARMTSGLEQRLTLGSLIRLRVATPFVAYFFIALCYTLLSLAFGLPFGRRFGRAGFLVFWMLNYLNMLHGLPHVYRYGYAFPFYNISRAVRTIVFRTKNEVGLNAGVLIAWVALSACVVLPLVQWVMRRRIVAAQRRAP